MSDTVTLNDIDRVADAIARKRGAGPTHLMPNSSAGQYRAMARAALAATADLLEERMQDFPQKGRHTRAGWAVGMIRLWSERHYWTELWGMDPGFTGGKDVGDYLDEMRGDA